MKKAMKGRGERQTPAKPSPRELLERLLNAADRACVARGEALWTNGYRTAYESKVSAGDAEATRLYEKEQGQWKRVGYIEGRMRRVFLAVLRDVRKQKARRSVRRRASATGVT